MRIPASRRAFLAGGAALLGAWPPASEALAQGGWRPSRAVRIVVPFSPGGSNDVLARPLAERLTQILGQSFVVENRPGAGGAIGADAVAKSAPDGHTLLFMSNSLTTAAAVQRLPYDPIADFTPVARVATAAMIVTVGKNFPGRTLGDLIRIARERPGSIRFGTTGPGDTGFFATELLKMATGTEMEPVTYRGITEAQIDAAAGRIEVVVTTVASARNLLDAGELRMLATAADRREREYPDVPTAREAGVDYATGVWWGVFGPARVPAPAVAALHAAVNQVLGEDAYKALLARIGADPAPLPQADFAAMVRADMERWAAIARRAGVAIR